MTENNPPTGNDAFWDHPDGGEQADASPAQPEPTAPLPQQPWGGSYPPPDAFPPGNHPPAGGWPEPGAPWPNQAPPYPSGPAYYASQQPGPVPGQPYYPPQQPGYPMAPYATQPPTKPRRTGLVILLSVLGLCLLLVVGGLLLRPQNTTTSGTGSSPGSGASGGGSVTPPVTASASDAVRGYLEALAAADAETALSYAANRPDDSALLTDEVLAASNAIAPITDIEVEPTTASGAAEVQAHYSIGTSDVIDTRFELVETASGWRLEKVASEVTVDEFPAFGTINGAAVPSADAFTLFPGSYQLGTSDGRYQVSGTFLVESVDGNAGTLKVPAKLSSTGVTAVRSAAQKRLNACIKENKMHPSDGCGFWIRAEDENGKKFKPKKVRWHITSGANTLKSVKLTVSANDPTVAAGKTKVKLYLRVDATNGRAYWATVTIASLRAILGDGTVEVRFNE